MTFSKVAFSFLLLGGPVRLKKRVAPFQERSPMAPVPPSRALPSQSQTSTRTPLFKLLRIPPAIMKSLCCRLAAIR